MEKQYNKHRVKQLDITDCGAACLASVLSFFGKSKPVSVIRYDAGTGKNGTSLLGLMNAAKKYGLDSSAVRVKDKKIFNQDLPAIAHLNIKNTWYHFVVIYKCFKDEYLIMDPAVDKIRKISKKEFNNIWTGVLLLLQPGKIFTQTKEKINVSERIKTLLISYKKEIIFSVLAAIIYSGAGIVTAIYIETLADHIIPGNLLNKLNLVTLAVSLILILRTCSGYIKNLIIIKTGKKIDEELINNYNQHILKLPLNFFQSMKTGEILTRINDAIKIRTFINTLSQELIVNVLIVGITLTLMFRYSWHLSLILLSSVPFLFLVYRFLNKINKKYLRKAMEQSAEMESGLVETVKGIQTIKAFRKEFFFRQKLANNANKLLNTIFKSSREYTLSSHFSELISTLWLLIILWYGSRQVILNQMTYGQLFSFYSLYAYISSPLISLVLSNRSFQDAKIATDRLFQVMDLSQEEITFPPKTRTENGNIRININNLCFSYPGKLRILNNITMQCQPGKITALTGESGCGKSTLISLLMRFYQSDKGEILFNHLNQNKLSLKQLRGLFSWVPQNIQLFSGSITDNICLYDKKVDPGYLQKIIKLSDLEILLEKLPNGLNTHISENGNNFSGGEKQKIAIARALYKNAGIFILDEPSLNMDLQSEINLMNLLKKLKDLNKTVLVITHKLKLIKNADCIYLINKGEIAESGNHMDLLSLNGYYQKLWNFESDRYCTL